MRSSLWIHNSSILTSFSVHRNKKKIKAEINNNSNLSWFLFRIQLNTLYSTWFASKNARCELLDDAVFYFWLLRRDDGGWKHLFTSWIYPPFPSFIWTEILQVDIVLNIISIDAVKIIFTDVSLFADICV